MRRAIDLVHYVVKDGLLQTSSDHASNDVRPTGNGSSSSPAPNQPKEVGQYLKQQIKQYTTHHIVYPFLYKRSPKRGKKIIFILPAGYYCNTIWNSI